MAALRTFTTVFAVLAASVAARDPLRASKLTSQSAFHKFESNEASKHFLRGPGSAADTQVHVAPFLMADAEVTGEVRWADTVAGWAGAARGLLHGKRRPSRYSRCNVCTMISCNKDTGICSGHCKRGKRLYTCRRNSLKAAKAPCIDNLPEISDLPAAALDPLHSVSVAATAPFMGCANITGLPSGCPTAGTRGEPDDGQRFTVLGSACKQYRYSIKQCERAFTPYYPFGFCVCLTRSDAGSINLAACRLPEVRYVDPAAEETDGVPVRVWPEGNTTMTLYGVREPLDLVRHRYNTSFHFLGATVDVEMVVEDALLSDADSLTLDGPLEYVDG